MVYWPDHWLIVWCLTYCHRYLWQHCCLNCAWYLTFWSNIYAAHVFYSQVYFCRSVLWDKALGICTLSANLATHPTLPVDHINPLPTFSIFTIYCIHRYIYYSHFNQYTHCIHYTHEIHWEWAWRNVPNVTAVSFCIQRQQNSVRLFIWYASVIELFQDCLFCYLLIIKETNQAS